MDSHRVRALRRERRRDVVRRIPGEHRMQALERRAQIRDAQERRRESLDHLEKSGSDASAAVRQVQHRACRDDSPGFQGHRLDRSTGRDAVGRRLDGCAPVCPVQWEEQCRWDAALFAA